MHVNKMKVKNPINMGYSWKTKRLKRQLRDQSARCANDSIIIKWIACSRVVFSSLVILSIQTGIKSVAEVKFLQIFQQNYYPALVFWV